MNASHNMKLKYVPASGDYYQKQIIIDESLVSAKSVKKSQIPENIQTGFLFNVHSHPVHYLNKTTGKLVEKDYKADFEAKGLLAKVKMLFKGFEDERANDPNLAKTFSFYSDTDINSLLQTQMMISGLVTDEFWLACKTDRVINPLSEESVDVLQNISNKAYSGEDYLQDVVSSLAPLGLVFYKARFGGEMRLVG